MNNFVSYVVSSIKSPLAFSEANLRADHCLINSETLAKELDKVIKTKSQELYHSLFSFHLPDVKQEDNGHSITGFKGLHSLSLDALILDFDSEDDVSLALRDAEALILDFQIKEYALFESGRKGYHLYVPAACFSDLLAPSHRLNKQVKAFAESLASVYKTLDSGIYDLPRKFRAPFSIHPSTGREKRLLSGVWPLPLGSGQNQALMMAFMAAVTDATEKEELKNLEPRRGLVTSIEDSETSEDSPDFLARFKLEKNKPCLDGIIEQTFPSGKRHHALLLVVFDLAASGHSESAIRLKVKAWIHKHPGSEWTKELESHLEGVRSGKSYTFTCKDSLRSLHCKSSCPLFSSISPASLASRPAPLDPKTNDAQEKAKSPVIVKRLSHSLVGKYRLVYVHDSDTFLALEGEKYVPVHKNLFEREFEARLPELSNLKNNSEMVATLKRLTGKSLKEISETTEGFINFKNGHFNKRTSALEPRDESRVFTYCLEFNYDPDAHTKAWTLFMAQCFNVKETGSMDLESRTVLHELMGAALSGDENWSERMLLLVGYSGANGKSTIFNVMRKLVGEEGFSSLGVRQLVNPKERETLIGKLINISPEEGTKAFIDNEHELKSISSKDAVSFRPLFQKQFSTPNVAKIWLACNEIPIAYDQSGGWARRFIILNFNNTAVDESEYAEKLAEYKTGYVYKKDVHLEDKLVIEAPGIFNEAWKAYKEAKARGSLTIPQSSRDAVKESTAGGALDDSLHSLFRECLEGEGSDPVWNEEVVSAVNGHFKDKLGITSQVSYQRILSRMRQLFNAKTVRTKSQRGLSGIVFREPRVVSDPSRNIGF